MAVTTHQAEKTLGQQMTDLLRRKPKNFVDVVFCVGPDKIKVEAVKFILQAASPVFEREIDDNWEKAVVTEGEGISLPDIDPTSFQLFVNLLVLDAWSRDSIKALKLSLNNLLNLLGLCRRYEITKAIKNLEKAADVFIQSFDKYKDTEEFLKISRDHLETIFSFKKLPLDEKMIFECACRWADNQCTIEGIEPTGENYLEVLGTCLFEIRFPMMSLEEFTEVCLVKKNVLKGDEQLAIFLFMGMSIDEKTNFDKSQLPFKTNPRAALKFNGVNCKKVQPQITTGAELINTSSLSGCLILSLPSQYKLTDSQFFVCDGYQYQRSFQVSKKISLHGVGFLGPVNGDTHLEVTLQIKRRVKYSWAFESVAFKKNIFARKGKIFYFLLDKPIVVESSTYDSLWRSYYSTHFSMKGPDNIAQYHGDKPKRTSRLRRQVFDFTLQALGMLETFWRSFFSRKCDLP